MIKLNRYVLVLLKPLLVFLFMFVFSEQAAAAAAATTTGKMPWETPLCDLSKSLTGTTAKAIALIGLFVAGGLMVFGGELSDFSRRITWMVLALSVMLAGGTLITTLFSGAGACP